MGVDVCLDVVWMEADGPAAELDTGKFASI
jgi:hypothetical protein